MNKRGQIYLFTAIIVCMLAFLLVSKPNIIREQVLLQNFKDISNNYLTESPKVINEVLEKGTPTDVDPSCDADPLLCKIKDKLSGFTGDFVDSYARNQDPNIGLIYIYNDENGVVIHNDLNGEIAHFTVPLGGEAITLLPGTTGNDGSIIVDGAGVSIPSGGNLCKDYTEDYCIITSGSLSGDVILNIGDIRYNFYVNPESPELIIILKSKDGETVKVDVSESTL